MCSPPPVGVRSIPHPCAVLNRKMVDVLRAAGVARWHASGPKLGLSAIHRTKPTSRSFIGKRAAGMELLRWIWPSSARVVRPTGTNLFFELETDATISQVNMTVPNKKVLNEILDINGDEGDTNMEEEMTEEHALHRA